MRNILKNPTKNTRLVRNHTSSTPPKIELSDKYIKVKWESGNESNFHNVWLLDHCRSSSSFHDITKQRLLNTFDIPSDLKVKNYKSDSYGLKVEWDYNNHVSTYPWKWLYLNSYSPKLIDEKYLRKNYEIDKVYWNKNLSANPPSVEYSDVMKDDRGLFNWMLKVDKYGLCFVDNVPDTPEATEELAKRVTFLRQTHYGTFWDFTADLKYGDTAYTNIALGAHTDTTYFTDPIGYQLFHLLKPATKGGGSSLFVDGFYCANVLKEIDEKAYETLKSIRIPSHSVGSEEAIMIPSQKSGYPIINEDNITGSLLQIRYNNDDRSVMRNLKFEEVEEFYRSLKIWNDILNDKNNEFWSNLEKGKVVCE